MCELLGMTARYPASLTSSLERFARRGGEEGPHADGWGLAHYAPDSHDVRLIREPERAASSAWVPFIRSQQTPSRLAVAHIRRATAGAPRLPNTQPFIRELGGRMHVFAHNGDLDRIDQRWRRYLRDYRPIGDTDSEVAFAVLMTRLKPLWDAAAELGQAAPSVAARHEVVAAFAEEMRGFGPANFLYSDGELLFAHGHRRKHNDGHIRPPGLVTLGRRCAPGEDSLVGASACPGEGCQSVTLFSSVPLTDEPWRPLDQGEIAVLSLTDGSPKDDPASTRPPWG
jgi:glutamine amidotransferase